MLQAPDDFWKPYGIDLESKMVVVDDLAGDKINRAIVANAVRRRYATAGDLDLFDDFLEALGPGIPRSLLEKPFVAGKSGVSTCGLVAEGFHAMAGVDAACLYEPYYPIAGATHYSIVRSIKYASQMGAWVSLFTRDRYTGKDPELEPGDMVVIGCRSAGEASKGTEHAITLVRKVGPQTWETVEAGQVDRARGGLQCAKLMQRTIEYRKPVEGRAAKERFFVTQPGSPGRKMLGVIKAKRLRVGPRKCLVPAGWLELPFELGSV